MKTSETETTGHLTVKGSMSVSGGEGARVKGDLPIVGGDIMADNISLRERRTSGVKAGGDISGPPVP